MNMDSEIGRGGTFENPLFELRNTEKSREEILEFAQEFAQKYTDKGNIKRIGIAGSVARGKKYPCDIDIILTLSHDAFWEYTLSQIYDPKGNYSIQTQLQAILKDKDNKAENFFFERVLGFDHETAKLMALELAIHALPGGGRVDIILLPEMIDNKFTTLEIPRSYDPTYISILAKDYQQFNSDTGNFESTPLYPETEMDLLRKAEFARLKEISTDPNHPDYKIYEKHPIEKHYKDK